MIKKYIIVVKQDYWGSGYIAKAYTSNFMRFLGIACDYEKSVLLDNAVSRLKESLEKQTLKIMKDKQQEVSTFEVSLEPPTQDERN